MASTIPDPLDGPVPDVIPGDDRAGRIEARGIDFIPDDQRHGRARELFAVWAAPSVSYLALVVGGALVLMGLDLWQSLAVIVAGNLFWLLIGLLATSGPASGTPSEVIMRAMYGIRGNRVNIAVSGWLVSVSYLAVNWAAASLAAFGLLSGLGVHVGTPVKVATILVIAVVTLAISVYGHATIVKLYLPLTWALAAAFAVLAVYVLGNARWDYRPANRCTERRCGPRSPPRSRSSPQGRCRTATAPTSPGTCRAPLRRGPSRAGRRWARSSPRSCSPRSERSPRPSST